MKIKAFTILEMAIVMLVTGILVSITFTCYRIVSQQYHDLQNMNARLSDLVLFNTAFNNDWNKAMEITGAGYVIHIRDIKEKTVSYSLYEDFTVRNSGFLSDTFYIATENIEVEYITAGAAGQQLVKQVFFEAAAFKKWYPFHFVKQYGKDVLMRD